MSRLSQLSDAGEVNVILNMERVLSRHDGPRDLSSMVGKYLYIAVLVQEETGVHTWDRPPACLKG